MKRVGSGGAPTCRHRTVIVRLMHANSKTLPCSYLPAVYVFQLLMSFIGLLQEIGVNLMMAFNFYGGKAKL